MLGFFSWGPRTGSQIKYIMRNLMDKDPTRVVFMYPELFFVVVIVFSLSMQANLDYWVILGAPIFLYLLTLTEDFNHLGEAYRYLEYSFTFLIPSFVALHYHSVFSSIIQLTVFMILALSYIGFRCLYKINKLGHEKPFDQLSEFLDNLEINEPAVIFPVNMRLGADIVARKTNWKSFWWQPGIISEKIYTDYIEEYPFLKKNWKPLAQSHGVTHIICSKNTLKELSTWHYDFSDQEIIAEDNEYIAYKSVF